MKEVSWDEDFADDKKDISGMPSSRSLLHLVNIVDVVSPHVALVQKRNGWHEGLCPFHSEKTASFGVNENSASYHCFGCKAKGNTIDFLMKIEGMSYREAIMHMMKLGGVDGLDGQQWARREWVEIGRRIDKMNSDDDVSIQGQKPEEIMASVAAVCGEALKEHPDDEDLFERVESVLQAFDEMFYSKNYDGMDILYRYYNETIKEGTEEYVPDENEADS